MNSIGYVDLRRSPASAPLVLRRTCAAEWTRLWTVKATWWFLLAAAVTTIGLGALLGLDASSGPAGEESVAFPAWVAGAITALPAQFALLALVLLAVTSDYGTGGIMPTLQWTPRRGVLLVARTIVPVVVATMAGVLLAVASSLAAAATYPALSLPLDEGAATLGRVALVLATGTTMAVGLGFLFRSTAGGLVGTFALMLVLPLLLPAFGIDWMWTLANYLPGTGAVFLLLDEGTGMTREGAVAVLAVWAVGALSAGGTRLLRSDADG